jgi:hypothetical protein
MGGKIEWVQLGAEASRRKCAAVKARPAIEPPPFGQPKNPCFSEKFPYLQWQAHG